MNLLFKHKSTYVWKCNVLLSSLKPGDINMSFWRVLNETLKKRCGFSVHYSYDDDALGIQGKWD